MSHASSSAAPTSAAPVTELKASAHLMLLDPGVFCVFNGPGSGAPDGRTGLPGVRISAAPAPSAHPGVVTLSGLDGDGWIGGTEGAALVRVSGGPAQILVTVYQAQDTNQAAPNLQVLRLTEPGSTQAPAAAARAPQAAAPAPQAAADAPMEVAAHIYGRGDVPGRLGEWMGERGSKRWIEGFGLQPAFIPAADIEYQAVLGRGWLSPWAEGGQFCGSRGMSLPILGLRVRLRGASAQTYETVLAATFVDGSQVGPVGNGEAAEAPSLAALESFLVLIRPRQQATAAPQAPATMPAQAAPAEPAPTRSARAKPTLEPAPAPTPAAAKRTAKPRVTQAAPAPAPASIPVRKPRQR